METPPSEKAPLWGIIARQADRYVSQNKAMESVNYVLEVGVYKPKMQEQGDFFLSSPIIRRIIIKHSFKAGDYVGGAQLYVNHYFKTAMFSGYTPTVESLFKHAGVANLFDLQVERMLAKKFPHYHMRLSNEASRERINQWIKRGRDPSGFTLLPIAKEQTRKRAITSHRKHHPRPRA